MSARCALLLVLLTACKSERLISEPLVVSGAVDGALPRTSDILAGPQSDAGALANPFEGNVHALQEGERLFAWFNCGSCHGMQGGGGMGVPLADGAWIYGSSPAEIRASILQGRPNGMPAFEGRIPEDQLWKLVAFVQTLKKFGAPDGGH